MLSQFIMSEECNGFFFYAYLQCDLHVLQYNDLTSDHSLLRLLTLLIADLRSIT